MKDIFEGIFEAVFSFPTLVALVILTFMFGIGVAIKNENAEKALTQAATKACYDGGLIKVDTDAGFYCVAPANLVKVKVK